MLAHSIIFYFFSFITIASSLMVIASKNTVHAVFFLILDFVSISSLFIMLGAEFLGMLTLIVYVGAVAVLFLLVVMMINVNFSELKSGFLEYIPFGLLIGLVILLELGMIDRKSTRLNSSHDQISYAVFCLKKKKTKNKKNNKLSLQYLFTTNNISTK